MDAASNKDVLMDADSAVFLLIDAAQYQPIWETLNGKNQQLSWLSLLESTGNADAIKAGPLLIHVGAEQEAVASRLLERAQGGHYLSWITSALPHRALRDHLSGLLDIETEDGSTWLMRYFDTRILPVWHAVLTDAQKSHAFGPILTWSYFNRAGKPCVIHGENRADAPIQGVLKLTQAQENALLDAAYPDAIIQQLENNGNVDLAAMRQGEHYQFIAHQIEKAQEKYKIESTPDTLLFCTLALANGADFDERTPVVQILQGAKKDNMSFGDAYLQHFRAEAS